MIYIILSVIIVILYITVLYYRWYAKEERYWKEYYQKQAELNLDEYFKQRLEQNESELPQRERRSVMSWLEDIDFNAKIDVDSHLIHSFRWMIKGLNLESKPTEIIDLKEGEDYEIIEPKQIENKK